MIVKTLVTVNAIVIMRGVNGPLYQSLHTIS